MHTIADPQFVQAMSCNCPFAPDVLKLAAGSTSQVMVVGDSGLGKTTLVRSLMSTPGERLQVRAPCAHKCFRRQDRAWFTHRVVLMVAHWPGHIGALLQRPVDSAAGTLPAARAVVWETRADSHPFIHIKIPSHAPVMCA